MSHADDLRTVLMLACETEDRTPSEQRALLRVAVKADRAANAQTVTNRREGGAWRLTALVESTGSPLLADSVRLRVNERADRWDREGTQ